MQRRRAARETVDEPTLTILAALARTPALIQGLRLDVLAWNPLGHALLAGHLPFDAPFRPERPNLARLVFLDPHSRELWTDWDRKARGIVGSLRLAAGRLPGDARLGALIGELSMASREFATRWADHRIRPCDAAAYRLHHPVVGELTLTQQAFDVNRRPEQTLLTFTAPPGSASDHGLTLLRELCADDCCGPLATTEKPVPRP